MKGNAAESRTSRRGTATARQLMLAGLFFAGVGGFYLGQSFLSAFGAAPVVQCVVTNAHGPIADISLADGRRLHLRFADFSNLEGCVPVGTSVEKRRFEMGYRIGSHFYATAYELRVGLGFTILLGLGLMSFGIVRRGARGP